MEGVSDLAQPYSTSAYGCISKSVERRSNKLAMATASLGMIANGVPLDQIFSDSTLVYIKWQRFLRRRYSNGPAMMCLCFVSVAPMERKNASAVGRKSRVCDENVSTVGTWRYQCSASETRIGI